jgi:hypothetical protein
VPGGHAAIRRNPRVAGTVSSLGTLPNIDRCETAASRFTRRLPRVVDAVAAQHATRGASAIPLLF